MSRTLSYADAARLLGGGESQLVKALDMLTGGLLIAGAAAGVPALLGWLDARTEFVRLNHELIRKVYEKRTGISRYTRTQRLEAAHTVLVVTAYFEALAGADLPFRFADLELTKDEQLAFVGPGAPWFIGKVLAMEAQPGPRDAGGMLVEYFQRLSGRVAEFVWGLAVWDRLSETDRDRFHAAMHGVPPRAGTRYEELFRQLAAEFPEVAYWAGRYEHRATRAEVRGVGAALSRLERMLGEMSTGRVPDQRRQELAQAYRKALERPIVASGEVPGDLRLPTLEAAYVVPAFRAGLVYPGAELTNESWWEAEPVRADLAEYLVGDLTSGGAVEAPLLVLGQPGSGKSVLTKVLAARLPAADFLPVRVALREVPAAASVQDQIEHAIRDTTGERLDWPALARSAGDALPVVILDGFDELLQATAVSQTDYLIRVAEFQRRELDQDRPVAVIVTSRTSVADRARMPDGTRALRLEPFDAERIAAWVGVWNATNEAGFRARGLAPLTAEALLAHRDLAGQPLLLLMLALYDAGGNALQQGAAGLRQHELYEQLLSSFARREVVKHRPGLPDRELDRAVELELRRLSVVAFGMFNRGNLWITEADLDSDLPALLGEAPAPSGDELRAPLRAAEIVLGRFFFVHRAQATRDDTRLETYEFLHATFGEFLVARLTWQVLRDIAAREAASILSLSSAPVQDDLLHALLSFAALSQRTPVIQFLTDLAAELPEADRAVLADLLIRLFRVVHQPRSGRGFASYQPRAAGVPARHAAYSANLVLLAVCVGGTLRASDLFGPEAEAVFRWRDEAMLWRSQLRADEWGSILDTLAVHRTWAGDSRDLQVELDRGDFRVPPIDPYWTYATAPGDRWREGSFINEPRPEVMHRRAYFLCRMGEDLAQHALEPLVDQLGPTIHTIGHWREQPDVASSAAHALLDAWMLPLRHPSAEERRATYERCLTIATADIPTWNYATQLRYAALLIDRLTTDDAAPASLAAELLRGLLSRVSIGLLDFMAGRVVRCALAFLGRGDRDIDGELASVIHQVADRPNAEIDPLLMEAASARLASLGITAAVPAGSRTQ